MERGEINRRTVLRYTAVGLTLALAVLILVASFFNFPRLEHVLLDNYLEANRVVVRFLAILMFVAAWHLHRRRQAALFLVSILLLLNLFLHLHAHALHPLSALAMTGVAVDVAALVLLFLCRNDFKRRPARQSVRQALTLGVVCVVFVLLDVGFGYFNLRVRAGESVSYGGVLSDILRFVFGMAAPGAPGAAHPLYEWFAVVFIWAGIGICVLLILRSVVIDRYVSRREKQRARALVMAYGMNAASYLTLEDDKLLYFGTGTEGVIAYGIVGDVIVVAGDPICAPENFTAFLAEFKGYCTEGAYQCLVMGAMPLYLEVYETLGFGHVKCGEVAKFDLATYTLRGNKMSKMRAEVNHANKETESAEYRPNEARDLKIEAEIEAVSRAWMKGKKSGSLAFSLGGVNLDEPMDRRYFVARNQEGKIVAFNVYLPFAAGDGYMADVTRRIPRAPGGVTEKLIYDAFMQFHEEGIRWGSLGLAPLAGMLEGEENQRAAKFLDWIYEHANSFYGFKDLHRAKEKYVPTEWEPAYFCYVGRFITPQMAYAAIRIQNPQGLGDFAVGYFRTRRAKKGPMLPSEGG